ncbi:SDR family NAD(P)-dependent oxidoreductase [Paucihalobacter ruber]|uniref:SDR family NAD(P)-dependent oxidoreductase n=1 Tax=Paucihalobacter ruber TaxID=2567861 RepID=A0A506PR42_9FLAO|nr:SDR family NAD(P)-dependent oxidoreductase [Paucihalobacter ruber]TPV35968.1 SDR family NAD(P)-dependent oxidoreductase [Paucihalobacter ruber]
MKKIFIITGANRGLGSAFVNVLMEDQNNFVISISRSVNEVQKTYAESNFYFLNIDLSQNSIDKKITILKKLINTEAIYFINNASIIKPISKIEDLDETNIDHTLSVNVKSTILITKYLLQHFNQNKLSFINISSGAANRPISHWSLYCSSKAFIKMFFNVAETEYPKHRFFNIDPGVMDTNMQENIRESNFPEVSNFKNLKVDGKLKSPKEVAIEILNTVI